MLITKKPSVEEAGLALARRVRKVRGPISWKGPDSVFHFFGDGREVISCEDCLHAQWPPPFLRFFVSLRRPYLWFSSQCLLRSRPDVSSPFPPSLLKHAQIRTS